jgi:ribosomal protein S18 acetylase RimI-like enzyme
VFPQKPEHAIHRNALLTGAQSPVDQRAAVDTLSTTYATDGVEHFAGWVHESDEAMCDTLRAHGFAIETSTRAMALDLADLARSRPEIAAASLPWHEYVLRFGFQDSFLAHADHDRCILGVARRDGEPVAAALAFDHEGDCGIYNVGPLEHARRQGYASVVTLHHLHDARTRGCQTASLQATPMAEYLQAAIDFRGLGRIHKYLPAGR